MCKYLTETHHSSHTNLLCSQETTVGNSTQALILNAQNLHVWQDLEYTLLWQARVYELTNLQPSTALSHLSQRHLAIINTNSQQLLSFLAFVRRNNLIPLKDGSITRENLCLMEECELKLFTVDCHGQERDEER